MPDRELFRLLMTLLALVSCATGAAEPNQAPRPGGGDDHAWMAYATLCALPEADREWLSPELSGFVHTYTHLPDCNWNNYGTFGGWSGLPDQPRTPDVRREWEICEFTGWNPNTGVGRRFGHAPSGALPAIAWYVPRIVEAFRGGGFMGPIIRLGCLSHLIQDCATFPGAQALHRSAKFDVSKISIEGYGPRKVAEDVEGLVDATTTATQELAALCEARGPDLRVAMQAGDDAAQQTIRLECCNQACRILADLYHTVISLVGECPRPGPAPLDVNLVRNAGVEEEDPGERLPRHWYVGYADLRDRVGRALWEGQVQRNARLWHTGRRSLKLMWTPAEGLQWRQTWPSSVYVRPGELYVASAWVKTYAATGSTQLVVAYHRDDFSKVAEVDGAAINGTSDWQRVTVAAAVPPRARRARIILRSKANEGAAWFDDVQLMRVSPEQFEKAKSTGARGDRMVLHMPFEADTRDHSVFGQLNSPVAAVSGTGPAPLLHPADDDRPALTLDGVDDFVEVPHSHTEDVLSPRGGMTLALWLKVDAARSAFICGKASTVGGKARGYKLELTEQGRVRLSVATAVGAWERAHVDMPTGRWVRVVALRRATGEMMVYAGDSVGDVTRGPELLSASEAAFYVGANHGASEFLAGRIRDLRVYREALAPDDIDVEGGTQDGPAGP